VKAYRFGEEADLEFQGQIDYFAEHAPGVGERFIADVDAAIRDIRAHPEIGSPITKLIRKRVLRVFKYNISGGPDIGESAFESSSDDA
jgi:plasmid stabilization system protein ParE